MYSNSFGMAFTVPKRVPVSGARKLREVGQHLAFFIVIMILALVITACGETTRVTPRVEAVQQPEDVSISLHGSTSVLVTSESDDPLGEIDEVRVFPTSVVLDPTDSVNISAIAFDARGQRMADLDVVWAAVDPRAGTITEDGRFTSGVIPGLYEDAISVTAIQNTRDGIRFMSQTAHVTVVGEQAISRLTSITVIPDRPTVLSGQIYRMRAFGFDQSGHVIPGVSFTWQTNGPELGRINELGFLTVEGVEGTYQNAINVAGVWEGVSLSTSADIDVIQAPEQDEFLSVQILPKSFHLDEGERLQLRAVALNGLGQIANDAQIRWSMEDTRAGTISGSGIFFAGVESGIYTESIKVEAVVGGTGGIARAEDFASVVVQQKQQARRLESVRVIPQSLVVPTNVRALLTAQGIDEFGKASDMTTVSWEALHESVGTIDDTGQFIASDVPGSYPESLRVTLRQVIGDEIVVKSKSVDVTITGTLSEIEIRPKLATISPGRTVHFTARGFDQNGNLLTGLITKWSVLNEELGVIDVFGNFTAGDFAGLYENAVQAEVIQRQPRRR